MEAGGVLVGHGEPGAVYDMLLRRRGPEGLATPDELESLTWGQCRHDFAADL